MRLLNGFSLSILILSVLTGVYLCSISSYNLLTYPSSIGSTNWSGLLSLIELCVGFGLVLMVSVVVGPEIDVLKITESSTERISTIFCAIMFLISFIVSMYRCGETGILPTNGVCIRTTGDLVCPTVLFRTEHNISALEDCKFNAFAENPAAWILTGNDRIDWSIKRTYSDKVELFRLYNLSIPNSDILNADEMITYEDCYYWGCDPVCNERHDYNIFLAWSSLFTSLSLFIILLLFIFMVDHRPMLVRFQTAAIPKGESESGEEADDEEEDDEDEEEEEEEAAEDEESEVDSADELLGKRDSFSGSKSWNFKLRM